MTWEDMNWCPSCGHGPLWDPNTCDQCATINHHEDRKVKNAIGPNAGEAVDNLPERLLGFIERRVRDGMGFRTTWLHEVFDEVNIVDDFEARDEIKEVIRELVASGELKAVTETFHDYCWIVPGTWVDRPRAGWIHVPKVECDIFDL